jgi:hypothetical protein
VQKGEQTDQFPFWSRVMLVQNAVMRRQLIEGSHQLHARQVFTIADWSKAAIADKSVEVAIDDADLILKSIAKGHRIAMMSMTKAPHDTIETTYS